ALGLLIYMMLGSYPGIAFAVSVLGCHTANLGEGHWNSIVCVYKYLQGTTD
ncbi:hypothetical protein CERSUDRAFT_22667, partial [Gelatoporia subvermispora B]